MSSDLAIMGEESAIVTAADGSAEAKMAPQEAFVISCLDSQAQRNDVHQKIKEFIKGLHEKDESTGARVILVHCFTCDSYSLSPLLYFDTIGVVCGIDRVIA